jgi:hypothetical protein
MPWALRHIDFPCALHAIQMKRLRRVATLPDAHILRGLLERAGIEAHVFNENAQSGVGQLPVMDAYPELWIADERDLDRAHKLLEEFDRAPREGGSVRCAACGEDNPANFQLCWNCGRGL